MNKQDLVLIINMLSVQNAFLIGILKNLGVEEKEINKLKNIGIITGTQMLEDFFRGDNKNE